MSLNIVRLHRSDLRLIQDMIHGFQVHYHSTSSIMCSRDAICSSVTVLYPLTYSSDQLPNALSDKSTNGERIMFIPRTKLQTSCSNLYSLRIISYASSNYT